MLFRLTNAPATFQIYINKALDGLLDTIYVTYINDIYIYSNSIKEYAKYMRQVLERLRKTNLYVKLFKYEFNKQEIAFLKYIVDVYKVRMDDAKIKTIIKWPIFRNFRDIQIFLGFANFYRRFILRFSRVVKPLTDLLIGMVRGRKTGPFSWLDEAEEVFRLLKELFTSAPILRMFNPELRIRIETDTSEFALRVVISQLFPDLRTGREIWYSITFWSRKMTNAKHNYETHDEKLLAVVATFKEWRHYTEGF